MTLTPTDIGLPSRFTQFRVLDSRKDINQFDIGYEIAASSTRFSILGVPPGGGKTVINMVAALLHHDSARILYLVSTNQLLSQVEREFRSIGIIPIMGMGNYLCNDAKNNYSSTHRRTMCNEGKCLAGYQCDYRQSGCDYYDQVALARNERLVLSNFALRASFSRYSDPDTIGKFDLIIVDEAHLLLDWMTDFCTIKVDRREYDKFGVDLPPKSAKLDKWISWAVDNKDEVVAQCEDRVKNLSPSQSRKYNNLASDVRTLASEVDKSNWVIDSWRFGVEITPIEPGQFLNRYIYRDAKNVILCSASITESDAPTFDCGDDYTYYQGGKGFPVRNRPLIWVPTCRVSYNMPESRLRYWLLQIDSLIDLGLDYRGIIHSVSYNWMRLIYDNSRHSQHMIIHRGSNGRDYSLPAIDQALDQYHNTKPPVVIVSPVLNTGYDGKYDRARWQIIAKVPFLNPNTPVTRARKKLWKAKYKQDYLVSTAAKTTVQTYGRVTRADDDWGITYVVDDAWGQYVGKNASVPIWVRNAMSTCWDGLPSKIDR